MGTPDQISLRAYTAIQPVMNLGFGFLFGLLSPRLLRLSFPLLMFNVWLGLMCFVSVRVVGDLIFNMPTLPWEWLRLYVYATCFAVGFACARGLRQLYEVPHVD